MPYSKYRECIDACTYCAAICRQCEDACLEEDHVHLLPGLSIRLDEEWLRWRVRLPGGYDDARWKICGKAIASFVRISVMPVRRNARSMPPWEWSIAASVRKPADIARKSVPKWSQWLKRTAARTEALKGTRGPGLCAGSAP